MTWLNGKSEPHEMMGALVWLKRLSGFRLSPTWEPRELRPGSKGPSYFIRRYPRSQGGYPKLSSKMLVISQWYHQWYQQIFPIFQFHWCHLIGALSMDIIGEKTIWTPPHGQHGHGICPRTQCAKLHKSGHREISMISKSYIYIYLFKTIYIYIYINSNIIIPLWRFRKNPGWH